VSDLCSIHTRRFVESLRGVFNFDCVTATAAYEHVKIAVLLYKSRAALGNVRLFYSVCILEILEIISFDTCLSHLFESYRFPGLTFEAGRMLTSYISVCSSLQVYKFKFDLQPGSLTDQVAGEHQPSQYVQHHKL